MEEPGPAEAPSRSKQRSDDMIFDVGMNVCEDTDFYLKKGFRVVAVEANPAVCRDAERCYAGAIAAGQLTILNRAIARCNAPLGFFVCTNNSAWSTTSSRLRDFWRARGAQFEEIEVPALTPSEFLAQYGVPYYAKIDIEGSDLLCLETFEASAIKPRYISLEVDFYAADELLDRLGAMGYVRFALIGQLTVPAQRPPRVAREGCYVDYAFEIGSSGLFGRELAVDWLDRSAMRRALRRVIWQHRLSAGLHKCAKFGAPQPLVVRAQRKYLPLAEDWYDLHAALE